MGKLNISMEKLNISMEKRNISMEIFRHGTQKIIFGVQILSF